MPVAALSLHLTQLRSVLQANHYHTRALLVHSYKMARPSLRPYLRTSSLAPAVQSSALLRSSKPILEISTHRAVIKTLCSIARVPSVLTARAAIVRTLSTAKVQRHKGGQGRHAFSPSWRCREGDRVGRAAWAR